MITKGKLTSLNVMTDKLYSFIEAEAYIQGIKDSGAPALYEAVRWVLEDYREDNYTRLKVSTHTQLLKALARAEEK